MSSLPCDVSSQHEIRRLAAQFQAAHPRLGVLVNNAGSVFPAREVTEDGIERTFAVPAAGPRGRAAVHALARAGCLQLWNVSLEMVGLAH